MIFIKRPPLLSKKRALAQYETPLRTQCLGFFRVDSSRVTDWLVWEVSCSRCVSEICTAIKFLSIEPWEMQ